jgi:prepilin-type N-terminal cleavage/methylation domain-containing protein
MRRKAFTLIELLVVIAIIGILVSISVVGWISVAQRGRDSTRKSDLARIKQVLQQQYSDTRTYPTFEINGAGPIYAASWQLTGTIGTCGHVDTTRLPTKYLDKVPTDPKDSSDHYQSDTCTTLSQNQTNRYLYISSPTGDGGPAKPATGFGLMATLEQNSSDYVADTFNPLKSDSCPQGTCNTVFGKWYFTGQDNYYQGGIGVTANYLIDNKGQ